MEYRTLKNGVKMPMEGFGTFQIPVKDTKGIVAEAIKAGYRMIDTAQAYGNEEGVGEAVTESGLPREDFFLITKIWPTNYGYEKTKSSIDESLKKLHTDYIDLLLLHQPYGDYYGAWRALEEAYKEGKVKAIGVSNFNTERVEDLSNYNEITPMMNEIEINPFYQRYEDVDFFNKKNVGLISWASFAEGKDGIFTNPVLTEIGKKYNKSGAQVILRWLLQRGITIIPKSVHADRMKQNLDIYDFKLSDEDMEEIKTINKNKSMFFDHETPESADMIKNMDISK